MHSSLSFIMVFITNKINYKAISITFLNLVIYNSINVHLFTDLIYSIYCTSTKSTYKRYTAVALGVSETIITMPPNQFDLRVLLPIGKLYILSPYSVWLWLYCIHEESTRNISVQYCIAKSYELWVHFV